MTISNGTYRASIERAYVTKIGAKQTDSFNIDFRLKEMPSSITWNGWMSEKAYERTLETLARLGFDESTPPESLPDGSTQYTAAHFSEKEVELVIEQEPDLKDPNRMWPRIKWVNIPSETKFTSAPIKGALPTDFKSQLAGARAKLGIKKSPSPSASQPKSKEPKIDEIPF